VILRCGGVDIKSHNLIYRGSDGIKLGLIGVCSPGASVHCHLDETCFLCEVDTMVTYFWKVMSM
jgi:hypothetical protein